MITISGLNFRGGIITHLYYYQEFNKSIDYAIQTIKGNQYQRIMRLFKERGMTDSDIDSLFTGNNTIYEKYNINILGEIQPILQDLDIKSEIRKVLWAMHKSCNENIPDYEDWTFQYNHDEILEKINKEIDKTLIAKSKRKQRQVANGSNSPIIIQTLAIAKKLGFSFDELQAMTTGTFISVIEEINTPKEEPAYIATQEDVNKWLQ